MPPWNIPVRLVTIVRSLGWVYVGIALFPIVWMVWHFSIYAPKEVIQSSAYRTQIEKIAQLQRYFSLATPVQAAEFTLARRGDRYRSQYYLLAAVKVDPRVMSDWIKKAEKATSDIIAPDVWNSLPLTDPVWQRQSLPQYYRTDRHFLVVYHSEGILLIRSR